jgi:acyl carrier protein
MKIEKKIIKKNIILFLKKKNKEINFNNKKIDLINDEILDSMDFLNLISFLEKTFKKKIDLSNDDPNVFSKIDLLTATIFKRLK